MTGPALLLGLIWAMNASDSHRVSAPLPPRRPFDLRSYGKESSLLERQSRESSTEQFDIEKCTTRLRALGVYAEPAITPPDGACFVATPVRIEGVVASYDPGRVIKFPNRPLMDCRLAEPLAHWLGEIVAPVLAASFASPLAAVRTGPGYECRNRNREAGGKISAHGIGLALDISGFELENKQILSFGSAKDSASETVLGAIRAAACGWFTTILGPGSDDAHSDHLHVDIQQHGTDGRYRICE